MCAVGYLGGSRVSFVYVATDTVYVFTNEMLSLKSLKQQTLRIVGELVCEMLVERTVGAGALLST